MMRWCLTLGLLACLTCSESTDPVETTEFPSAEGAPSGPADAGVDAFVRRLLPLMWGRHARSVHEVRVLSQMEAKLGREGLVRVMAKSPEYLDRWDLFFKDALGVSRIGYYSNAGCYGRNALPEVLPDLAAHVRDHLPDGEPYPVGFTMRDLIQSALRLDDLSPIYTSNLIANLMRALDDQNLLAAFGQRRNRVQTFLRHYLNRRMNCLGCHNSEYSVTGDPDPALDRTWEIPGYFEKALFGSSAGRDHVDLTSFFRRRGVLVGYYYVKDFSIEVKCPNGMCPPGYVPPEDLIGGMYPWGWDPTCGHFYAPESVRADDADVSPFFIEAMDTDASVWDLEARLQAGFAKIRERGLTWASDPLDLTVDPEEAFAWLVSMNIADMVWEAAFGHRLTTVNYFPRNQMQRDRLQELTDTFVSGGFSLQDVLVAVTTHPYFNGLPPQPGEDPAPFAPVFEPFINDEIPVEQRRNAIGHTVQRAPARTLLNSAFRAMGWPRTPEFLIYFMSPDARLQRNVGVFHKTGDPGFSGTSFQSALAWEALVGVCEDRNESPQCPLEHVFSLPDGQIKATTLCELCGNQDYACDWDARCCDLNWDAICTIECGGAEKIDLEHFPKPDLPAGEDWIGQLIEAAAESGEHTVGDLVGALKDRLLADPRLDDPAERAALEAVLDAKLSDPIAGDATLEERLRRVCGVFLASPQFLLLGLPSTVDTAVPAVAVPGNSYSEICEELAAYLFEPGQVDCLESTLEIR